MNTPQQHRIMISLVLALLVHAALLLVFMPEKQKMVLAFSDKQPSISVTLEAINVAPAITKKNASPKVRQKNKINKIKNNKQADFQKNKIHVKKTRNSFKPKPVTNLKETKLVNTTPNKMESSLDPTKTAVMRAKIIARIRNDLKQYFYYPDIAKRKNIQGTVRLGFGINPSGVIYDIRVVKTSGYTILDLAAEQSMQQLHSVQWTKELFAKSDIALELPIIYKLME